MGLVGCGDDCFESTHASAATTAFINVPKIRFPAANGSLAMVNTKQTQLIYQD